MGRFLPADPSKGDPATIGGYMAVHDRPAAFEGPDGMSYSVALETDATGDAAAPFGAYLLFLRWRRIGPQGVEGHLETEFLTFGATPEEARERLGRWSLDDVKARLDAAISEEQPPARPWWAVMRDDGESGKSGADA